MERSFIAAALGAAALFAVSTALAEEPGRALGLEAGLAIVAPSDANVKGAGAGAAFTGELVYWQGSWFSPRAYVGALLTSPTNSCATGVSPCELSADLFYFGGKFRLMAPIPYIGPFLELGLGASAGHLTAHVGQSFDHDASGLFLDIPFALGLAIGGEHRFQLALQYLFHPGKYLVTGALVIGYDFPF